MQGLRQAFSWEFWLEDPIKPAGSPDPKRLPSTEHPSSVCLPFQSETQLWFCSWEWPLHSLRSLYASLPYQLQNDEMSRTDPLRVSLYQGENKQGNAASIHNRMENHMATLHCHCLSWHICLPTGCLKVNCPISRVIPQMKRTQHFSHTYA